jgi:hypothetical protein
LVERAVNHDGRLVAQQRTVAQWVGIFTAFGEGHLEDHATRVCLEFAGISGLRALGLKNISKTSPFQSVSFRWAERSDLGVGERPGIVRERHRPRRGRREFPSAGS